MPEKKPAPGFASAFMTADKLLKEDHKKSENERRLERWADMMVRERKLDPSWKEDKDAAVTARWIGDRTAPAPAEKAKKSPVRKV